MQIKIDEINADWSLSFFTGHTGPHLLAVRARGTAYTASAELDFELALDDAEKEHFISILNSVNARLPLLFSEGE